MNITSFSGAGGRMCYYTAVQNITATYCFCCRNRSVGLPAPDLPVLEYLLGV